MVGRKSKIAIVGAGIGGLAAAVTLRQPDWTFAYTSKPAGSRASGQAFKWGPMR
jgi:cation diffusion facilitator CzcD-associated flavoprotein CzcO